VSQTFVIRREMGCTRQEFLGWLPRATGGDRYEVDGDRILIHPDGGAVQIDIRQADPRRLGLLSLPVLQVRIEFLGLSQPARDRFLQRFDLATRRGGG
jgi:hypothetical protein